MDNILVQLALILSLSCVLGFVVHRLKLPLVVAYLLTGVLISVLVSAGSSAGISHLNVLTILPEIGVAFVLFLIGMELDVSEIRALGKPIIIASLGQITISSIAGYAIAGALGFPRAESILLGLGLSFSSTVVVVKLLLEKRDLVSLYGKLSIGILLLEDFVAIITLMVISVGSSALNLGLTHSWPILALVLKALGLFGLTFVLSKYVLGRIFDAVAKSTELLFLTAITWCFLFTTLAILSGFSVVIGAFLAGVALASSPYHFQIQGKVKPLRDFFVTLFFVYLGSQARVEDILTSIPAILAFLAYASIAKPLIFMLILGMFGFRKHTLFQTALNLSQISEFSLVLMLVGVRLGLTSPAGLSIIAAVAVVSIICSSILITYSKRIYKLFQPFLPFFEQTKNVHYLEIKDEDELDEHVVVIGAHRVGGPVVTFLRRQKIPFIVMDFNPRVLEELHSKGVKVIYGDVGDPEILDSLQLEKAKLIISTATDMTDNEILLEECKRRKVRAKVVSRALDEDHAKALKDLGADYVILPEQVSGDFLVSQLRSHWPEIKFVGLD